MLCIVSSCVVFVCWVLSVCVLSGIGLMSLIGVMSVCGRLVSIFGVLWCLSCCVVFIVLFCGVGAVSLFVLYFRSAFTTQEGGISFAVKIGCSFFVLLLGVVGPLVRVPLLRVEFVVVAVLLWLF